MTRRCRLLAAIACFVSAGIGCNRAPHVDANALLPATADSGWTRTEAARAFPAAELWRYMDGGADKYVAAGVQTTVTAPYRNGAVEANVDVHVMKDAEAAVKLFESETAVGAHDAEVGDAGRAYAQSVVFRRGRYLARVVGFAPGQASSALLSLARSLDRQSLAQNHRPQQ